MTHYLLITSTLKFKLSYNTAGKFKRLQHESGKISKQQLDKIGVIIPPNIDDVSAFAKAYPQITYQPLETTSASPFTLFTAAWHVFYEGFTGLPPKFNAADGAALKRIIKHFETIGNTPQQALQLWQALLHNWPNLSEFHRKNTDLKYIDSQLNKILHELKSNHTSQHNAASDFKFS